MVNIWMEEESKRWLAGVWIFAMQCKGQSLNKVLEHKMIHWRVSLVKAPVGHPLKSNRSWLKFGLAICSISYLGQLSIFESHFLWCVMEVVITNSYIYSQDQIYQLKLSSLGTTPYLFGVLEPWLANNSVTTLTSVCINLSNKVVLYPCEITTI